MIEEHPFHKAERRWKAALGRRIALEAADPSACDAEHDAQFAAIDDEVFAAQHALLFTPVGANGCGRMLATKLEIMISEFKEHSWDSEPMASVFRQWLAVVQIDAEALNFSPPAR